MQQSTSAARTEFQDRPVTPLFTMMMCFGLMAVYAFEKMNKAGIPLWLDVNAFNVDRVHTLYSLGDYKDIASIVAVANFASYHVVQMALNMYFVFVFGSHLEKKLGPPRYMMIVLMGLSIPWALLTFLTAHNPTNVTYVGPAFLLCTIIGCYMVFPPIPKSKLGQGSVRDRTQIFRREPRADPIEKYTGNPWMFVITFLAIQTAFHFLLAFGLPWILKPYFQAAPNYESISIFPALLGLGLGYVVGELMAQSATAHTKDSPMTLQAIKTYHELLDLDVKHDDALKGTARALGLPYDKVKQWIQQNKGKLRVK